MPHTRLLAGLPREIRVLVAVLLGLVIISLAYYGASATKADVLFAEMAHTISDTLVLLILFLGFISGRKTSRWLGKVSGVLLLLAGGMALYKAYRTFSEAVGTGSHAIEQVNTLLIISVSTVLIIAVQMTLVWSEHGLLHGHDDNPEGKKSAHHLHTVHSAAKVELLADISQAFAGLLEYIVIQLVPGKPIMFRFVDLALTIGIGWWMIQRGGKIILEKESSHHHH